MAYEYFEISLVKDLTRHAIDIVPFTRYSFIEIELV
jgi:hypothetical protein